MILGLDASTSVCGWCFSDNGEIKDAGFIDISKFDSNKDKAFHIIGILNQNPLNESVDKVNLEAALSGFMGGKTSQQTIIKLARFNAVLEYILGEEWKIPVTLVNAMTARKKVFGKARQKGIKSKEFVKQELHRLITLPTKWDVTNKIGGWNAKNSDMYDAMVCALYG
jgi:hypothetical protein